MVSQETGVDTKLNSEAESNRDRGADPASNREKRLSLCSPSGKRLLPVDERWEIESYTEPGVGRIPLGEQGDIAMPPYTLTPIVLRNALSILWRWLDDRIELVAVNRPIRWWTVTDKVLHEVGNRIAHSISLHVDKLILVPFCRVHRMKVRSVHD